MTAGIALFYAWTYALQPDGSVNFVLRGLGLGSLAQPQGWSSALGWLMFMLAPLLVLVNLRVLRSRA